MPHGEPDHSPSFFELDKGVVKVHMPFKLFNHVVRLAEFLHVVGGSWNNSETGDPMQILHKKLKRFLDLLVKSTSPIFLRECMMLDKGWR